MASTNQDYVFYPALSPLRSAGGGGGAIAIETFPSPPQLDHISPSRPIPSSSWFGWMKKKMARRLSNLATESNGASLTSPIPTNIADAQQGVMHEHITARVDPIPFNTADAQQCLDWLEKAMHEHRTAKIVDYFHLRYLIDACHEERGKIMKSRPHSESVLDLCRKMKVTVSDAQSILHSHQYLTYSSEDLSRLSRGWLTALRSQPPDASDALRALVQLVKRDIAPDCDSIMDLEQLLSTEMSTNATHSSSPSLMLLRALVSVFLSLSPRACKELRVLTAWTVATTYIAHTINTTSEAAPSTAETLHVEDALAVTVVTAETRCLRGGEEDASVDIMRIFQCIRLLCQRYRDTMEYEGANFSRREFQEAAAACLSAVWTNDLEPRMMNIMHHGSSNIINNSPLMAGMHPLNNNHAISLLQLVEVLVSLIMDLVPRVHRYSTSKLVWLVEQVCANEIAGPIAVREGILSVLVRHWFNSADLGIKRAAIFSVRHLSLVRNPCTREWIHMEMMHHRVIRALFAERHSFISSNKNHDVVMAVLEVLLVMCETPHTLVAVVQGECFGFLLQHHNQLSQENKWILLIVLVDLVKIAVKTVSEQEINLVLHPSFLTHDLAKAFLE